MECLFHKLEPFKSPTHESVTNKEYTYLRIALPSHIRTESLRSKFPGVFI